MQPVTARLELFVGSVAHRDHEIGVVGDLGERLRRDASQVDAAATCGRNGSGMHVRCEVPVC